LREAVRGAVSEKQTLEGEAFVGVC